MYHETENTWKGGGVAYTSLHLPGDTSKTTKTRIGTMLGVSHYIGLYLYDTTPVALVLGHENKFVYVATHIVPRHVRLTVEVFV
jgi:hypothetical protein